MQKGRKMKAYVEAGPLFLEKAYQIIDHLGKLLRGGGRQVLYHFGSIPSLTPQMQKLVARIACFRGIHTTLLSHFA